MCVWPWRTIARWDVCYILHNVEDLRERLTSERFLVCGYLLRVVEAVVIRAVACGVEAG
jgi:hypothetical protein